MKKPVHPQPYEIYLQTFAKLICEVKMSNNDFGTMTSKGLAPFEKQGKAAVGIAAQDAKTGAQMKSEREFTKFLDSILE